MDILTLMLIEVVIKAFKVEEKEIEKIDIMKIKMIIEGVINKKNQKNLTQIK